MPRLSSIEAVSNAVRHSGASHLTIDVSIGDDLVVDVIDDGCGISADNDRRSGLTNLRRRAEQVGGACEHHLARVGRNSCPLDDTAHRFVIAAPRAPSDARPDLRPDTTKGHWTTRDRDQRLLSDPRPTHTVMR